MALEVPDHWEPLTAEEEELIAEGLLLLDNQLTDEWRDSKRAGNSDARVQRRVQLVIRLRHRFDSSLTTIRRINTDE
jgi:uncharacterized protein (DUF924 family)